MPKVKVEVGQEIFVCCTSSFYRLQKPNLKKWIVVKSNKTSFYANPEDCKEGKSPTRFSQRSLTGSDTFSEYAVYPDEETYWSMIATLQEKKALKQELKEKIDIMDLKHLRKLKEMIDSK